MTRQKAPFQHICAGQLAAYATIVPLQHCSDDDAEHKSIITYAHRDHRATRKHAAAAGPPRSVDRTMTSVTHHSFCSVMQVMLCASAAVLTAAANASSSRDTCDQVWESIIFPHVCLKPDAQLVPIIVWSSRKQLNSGHNQKDRPSLGLKLRQLTIDTYIGLYSLENALENMTSKTWLHLDSRSFLPAAFPSSLTVASGLGLLAD